jgi:hypothetical protein
MKWKPILRLSAFLAAVVPVIGLVLLPQKAEGSVFESFLSFGKNMEPYLDDKRTTEEPRTIVLNGQILHVAVGVTPHTGGRVKDFYLDQYHGSQEALQKIAAAAPGKHKAPPTELVFGDDDEGGLVAFDFGKDLSLKGLAERYVKFAHTRRVGDMGQVRFVKWTKDAHGGARFFTMWTDSRFSLDKLIPPHGVDVDGGDLADVPRVPGMTRVLAMDEKGKPWTTRVYEGPGSVSNIAMQLAYSMEQRGWIENKLFAKSSPNSVSMRFDYGARTVVFALDESARGMVDLAVIGKGG